MPICTSCSDDTDHGLLAFCDMIVSRLSNIEHNQSLVLEHMRKAERRLFDETLSFLDEALTSDMP